MSTDLVLTEDHGAVRVITLNRPQARNALSRDLIRACYAALTAADADESVRAVVLTGADPAFCAGVDLKKLRAMVFRTSRSSARRAVSPRWPPCRPRWWAR